MDVDKKQAYSMDVILFPWFYPFKYNFNIPLSIMIGGITFIIRKICAILKHLGQKQILI